MISQIIVKPSEFDPTIIYELWRDEQTHYYYWVDVSFNDYILPELFHTPQSAKRWLIRMCDDIGALYTERDI